MQPALNLVEPLGNFTASSLRADPETGLLEQNPEMTFGSNGIKARAVFDVAKKLQALNLLWDWWPNVSKVCDMIGISRDTFNNHYGVDTIFRQVVDSMRERVIDRIEHVRMKVANTPSGSFDRMCVLNAYRRELYNPKQMIEVQHTLTIEQSQRERARMESVIDAEVIETVQRIKAARKKMNRP